MRALLDTHTFIWFNLNDPRLGAQALSFIVNGENEVLLSAASAWEIAIKPAVGRLPELPFPPVAYVPSRLSHYGFTALPIELAHAWRVGGLPPHHRDPFDRLLIAQAQVEGVPILT